jgi:hypothetical protein
MSSGRRARWRGLVVPAAAFAAGVLAATIVVAASSGEPAPASGPTPAASSASTPSPSVSPVTLVKIGGAFGALPDRTIDDPTLLPYPFMSPTPPPAETVLDGTYLRTLTLRDVGGARIGLPFRCLRCPPFRVDAGVSTLIFTRGAYYIHHQLSGFRTHGSFVVERDRVTLFNDANCPQTPGVYEFEITAHGLRFRVIEDVCSFSNERAKDLTTVSWTRVPACVKRIQNLWPGEVAC